MKAIDFIEIGTSNFNTLIQECNNETSGISIEPISYYLECLPNKKNVTKIQSAVTHNRSQDFIEIFYIPENIILQNKLPIWFRGCNKIGEFHPLHIKHGVESLVVKEVVPLKNFEEIMNENDIEYVNEIKIDTEGHDCTIMSSIYQFYKSKPIDEMPKKISFETNENSIKKEVEDIIEHFRELGYSVKRGYDTILERK